MKYVSENVNFAYDFSVNWLKLNRILTFCIFLLKNEKCILLKYLTVV